MEELEFAANKWLKLYPNAMWRENVEVLLVAIAVAMAIRTFFLQPFKIPTGSMQPTLYGVTSMPDFSPTDISRGLDNKAEIGPEVNRPVGTAGGHENPRSGTRQGLVPRNFLCSFCRPD